MSDNNEKGNETIQGKETENEMEGDEGVDEINLGEEIVKLRMKLEQLRQKKKSLENEGENLTCKINDLRLIIQRISDED